MKPALAEKTENPFNTPVCNLTAWQQELVSVMGARKKCLAFLSKVLLKKNIASSPESAQANNIEEILNLQFENNLLSSAVSISDLFADIIKEESIFRNYEKKYVLKQVLWAAYLQPYATLSYRQLTLPVRHRVLFIYLYLHAKEHVLLPDLLTPADECDKILLQKTLQNLRLLFNEPKTIFLYTQNPKEAIFISDRILLLNHHKHHAGLSDVISVHFKEPRHRHIISQLPAYKAIRKKLIYALTDACAPTDLLLFPSINLLS